MTQIQDLARFIEHGLDCHVDTFPETALQATDHTLVLKVTNDRYVAITPHVEQPYGGPVQWLVCDTSSELAVKAKGGYGVAVVLMGLGLVNRNDEPMMPVVFHSTWLKARRLVDDVRRNGWTFRCKPGEYDYDGWKIVTRRMHEVLPSTYTVACCRMIIAEGGLT